MEAVPFLVNGEWRTSQRRREIRNPYNGELVGEACLGSPRDLEDAISGAVRAFRETRLLSSARRSAILAAIARELEARKEQFAGLITGETGKPISLSRVEVDRAVFTLSVSSDEARRIGGEMIPLDLGPGPPGSFGLVRHFPLGPVAAITPFNFPLNLVVHKLGPAFAAGNTVVLKPSSSALLVALELGKIIERSGLPPGSLSIVPCVGDEASQLITDERLRLITFTGSPAVGWPLKGKAGRKRVVLELGGNAGVIVDQGANLAYALRRILQAAYGHAGQSCIAVQRIFVHESLKEEFTRRFVELSASVAVGDPNDERTLVGPMITEEAARKVEGWIREAVTAGAQVLCGATRSGAVLVPTVITGVRPDMAVCANEVFAPVATLEFFSSFADAVACVNNSRYGLQAGVFTNSLDNVLLAYRDLEVGGVIVNDAPTFRIDHMPYGGVKDSGFGREGVRYAIQEMTEMKLLSCMLIP